MAILNPNLCISTHSFYKHLMSDWLCPFNIIPFKSNIKQRHFWGSNTANFVCVHSFLSLQFNKHLFVHIGQSNPSYSDPYLESVDIRQIYDKFPEKKGGLKELFDKGPHNAFFLVKFWVRLIWKTDICFSFSPPDHWISCVYNINCKTTQTVGWFVQVV